jgi:uncharacterized membrane protein HdeD (DUF308 family)
MSEITAMPMCPMATACKGMMENRKSGFLMIVPGLLFIALGVTIIMYPQILVWFVAIALIVMGIAMLMMVKLMRKFGKRVESTRH